MSSLPSSAPVETWLRLLPDAQRAANKWQAFVDAPTLTTLHQADRGLWRSVYRELQGNNGDAPTWIPMPFSLSAEINASGESGTVETLASRTLVSFETTLTEADFAASFAPAVRQHLKHQNFGHRDSPHRRRFSEIFWLSAHSVAKTSPEVAAYCFHLQKRVVDVLASASIEAVLDFVIADEVNHQFRLRYPHDVACCQLRSARSNSGPVSALAKLMATNLSAVGSPRRS